MKKSFFNYLFIFGIVGFVLYSCVKKTTYPKIPEIEFKDFFPFANDSADLQIKFTDGDGDIGVNSGDTTRTLFYTYYYMDTITHQFIGYYSPILQDTSRIGYVVNSPSDAYNGKPISGEINISLQKYRHSKKIKKVKYVIYLYDKAGNKSNVLTTPELDVP